MGQVTFNQEVKHGTVTYYPGDTVTVDDELAAYFGAQGWLEGVEKTATDDSPVVLEINPGRSIDLVPENPYENDKPLKAQESATHSLDISSARHGVKDTSNG